MGISAFSTLANVSASTRLALVSVASSMPSLSWGSSPAANSAATDATDASESSASNTNAGPVANAYSKAIPSLRASHPLAGNLARARSRRLLSLVKTRPLSGTGIMASQASGHERTSPVNGNPVVVSRLRVLREFEPGKHPAAAGRMVISGRMVDVCAELDRLAGTDAAH